MSDGDGSIEDEGATVRRLTSVDAPVEVETGIATDGEEGEVLPLQPPTDSSPASTDEMAKTFGQSFNPQPFGYVVTRGTYMDQPAVFLTFEHAHGRISFPLSDLEAQGLANRLSQNVRGGLVVARDMPPKPT